MSDIKQRLIGAITVMDEDGAQRLWKIVEGLYSDDGWSSISEEEPDEIDLQMIREALGDPDCREFVSAEEILSSLD